MSGIKMNFEEMRGKAQEFRACSEEMNDVVSRMRGITDSLCAEWEGVSSDRFRDQFTELEEVLKRAAELGEEIGAQVDSISQVYEEADQAVAGKLGY